MFRYVKTLMVNISFPDLWLSDDIVFVYERLKVRLNYIQYTAPVENMFPYLPMHLFEDDLLGIKLGAIMSWVRSLFYPINLPF